MADFATHYIFGELVFKRLKLQARLIMRNKSSFNWGLIGPDLLYYHNPLYQYGTLMHSKKTNEIFYEMAQHINSLKGRESEIARAYFYGFLCHYALDSSIHPYVYYHQHRLENKYGFSNLHRKIESDIDVAISTYYRLVTNDIFPPSITADFMSSPLQREVISTIYSNVFCEVFDINLQNKRIKNSFFSTIMLQSVLYGGAKILQPIAKTVEASLNVNYHLSASFKHALPEWDCLNRRHRKWVDECAGAVSSRGVIEILEAASIYAAFLIEQHVEMFDCDCIEKISYSRDFRGRII